MRKLLLAVLLSLWAGGMGYAAPNLPNNPNAAVVQGPDPTGQLGYPLAIVPATGTANFPVTTSGSNTPADGFATPTNASPVQGFPQVYNGTTWDLLRNPTAANGSTTGAGILGTAVMGWSSSAYNRIAVLAALADANSGASTMSVGPWIWNGTNWDRTYEANAAAGTTGTGLLGAGLVGFDGTNWQRVKVGSIGNATNTLQNSLVINASGLTDASSITPNTLIGGNTGGSFMLAVQAQLFNGATYDRMRAANALDTGLSTGVQATHDVLTDNNNGTFTSVTMESDYRYRVVSATNTQQQVVLDCRNIHDTLSIHMAASAGTATLTVEASADNSNWIQADSLTAAQFTVKVYGATTAGAAAAAASAGPIAPLAYRWVRVTAGAAGAGNTTTLTIGAK